MSIFDRIMSDVTASQKAGQADKLAALRLIVNSLKNQAKELKKDSLSDDEAIKVLQKEAKKRREAISAYDKGGRPELAAKEKQELEWLEPYLPQQMSDADLQKLIETVVSEQKLSAPYELGPLMGAVMKKAAGQADGQRVKGLLQKFVEQAG